MQTAFTSLKLFPLSTLETTLILRPNLNFTQSYTPLLKLSFPFSELVIFTFANYSTYYILLC